MRHSIWLLFTVVAIGFFTVGRSQLVTPFQICEMEQMKLRNLASSVSYNDPVMVQIRNYCQKHAFDHIGNLGTLG